MKKKGDIVSINGVQFTMKATPKYFMFSLDSNPCEGDTLTIKKKTYTFTSEEYGNKYIQIGFTLQQTGENILAEIPSLKGTYRETTVITKRWFCEDKVENYQNYTFRTKHKVKCDFCDVLNDTI